MFCDVSKLGLGEAQDPPPFRYSVAIVSLSRGHAQKLRCVYGCRDGVKGLKSRYVLGIPTSLALLCLVVIVETHTHTHTFNGPFSGTTQVSRYQKRKTNLNFTEARDSEWQWHPLCKFAPRSSQITTPVPHHSFFTSRMPFLPPNQQRHRNT